MLQLIYFYLIGTDSTLQQPAEQIKTFHLSKTDKPCYIKGEIRSE